MLSSLLCPVNDWAALSIYTTKLNNNISIDAGAPSGCKHVQNPIFNSPICFKQLWSHDSTFTVAVHMQMYTLSLWFKSAVQLNIKQKCYLRSGFATYSKSCENAILKECTCMKGFPSSQVHFNVTVQFGSQKLQLESRLLVTGSAVLYI